MTRNKMRLQTGNTALVLVLLVGIGLVAGGYFLTRPQAPTEEASQQQDAALMEKDETAMDAGDEAMMDEGETAMMDDEDATGDEPARAEYTDYTTAAFAAADEQKRVLFFHASWCPTCKVANNELSQSVDELPADVVVFKTDYDTESELKKQHNVVTQHTFVQVDENGDAVNSWVGGGVDQIAANVQ